MEIRFMMNLAGVKDCDTHIERELSRIDIEIVRGPRVEREVATTTITGKLGQFKLTRLCDYWSVKGPFPLEVATHLYDTNMIWRQDVRAGGHCSRPPPRTKATFRNIAGLQILDRRNENEAKRHADQNESLIVKSIGQTILRDYVFADDPQAAAHHATVDLFHIDSEVGLYMWAEMARAHLARVE
jgi:hypothetical protein